MGEMRLGLSQSARMEQRLVQSPQMIQAMQILQLPTAELAERIETELVENPFLEVKDPALASQDGGMDGERDVQRTIDTLERFEKAASEMRSLKKSSRLNREASDQRYEALQNTPEQSGGIAKSLISLLHIQDLSDKETAIGEYIIYSLDERGYLTESVESIASALGAEVTVEEVQRVLKIIQEIGPAGIAAHDLKECLLLQLSRLPEENPLTRILIENHLEDIQSNRLPKIAKDTGKSIPEIKTAIEFMRKLDPRPGSRLGQGPSVVIQPDVVIEEIDGNYELRLERGGLPDLQISSSYRDLLTKVKSDPKVHEFLKKRIESAKYFIDAVLQRQSTIERICREIVRRQRDFLDHGVEKLHPLKMQDVADAVGVHISTVSRAIAGKYIQTPQGIFDLKFFFTGGTVTDSGDVESQTSIKEKIVEIIAAEDRRQPLSDEDIAHMLKERQGLPIARRTVTKYRKTMKIPPSNLRRQY